jgi:outer membrane PBP1 activator LpoA protein
MSRFNALLLLFLTALVSPAFSADPPARTTDFGPTAPVEDIDPATGLSRTTVVRPLSDAPPVPEPRRAPPVPARAHIALILPTSSPALGRLAEAVRQGFAAAAEAAGREALPVAITALDAEGMNLLDACRASQAAGAVLVVAGLTRDGASALARSDCPRQPTLVLNEPQGVGELPANLYSVSLSLENEARQVALLAVAEGWRSAIVITSLSPLARRVQEAFEREWARAAGQVSGRLTFTGTAEDAPLVRDRIAAVRADMVFMALDQPEARAVRPYVSGMLPLYATSMSINPRAEAIVNVDLQGVRYVEMPWFVQPDHPAVMVYPQPRVPMSVEQERLYAFGIDAYRLATQLLRGERRAPLDGVTGKLILEPGNVFSRTLVPAEVDGGRVIPLRAQ